MKRPGVNGQRMRVRQRKLAHASNSPRQKAGFGYKDTHHLIEEKVPPASLVRMREELAKPQHADIYRRAYHQPDFATVLGSIAADLDIVLDGEYDAEDLCDLLHKALVARGTLGNNPHNLDPRLRQVELVEREGDVTLEEGGGTIAPVPTAPIGSGIDPEVVAYARWMHEQGCIQCDNKTLCKMAGRCCGDASRAPEKGEKL
jgi:hypothetical protein